MSGDWTKYYKVTEFPEEWPDPLPEVGNLHFEGSISSGGDPGAVDLAWANIQGKVGPYNCPLVADGECVDIESTGGEPE